MITAILVDDHRMFRESLRKLIEIQGIAKVLGEASNGQELLDLLESHRPDIVVMDISMPVMDGIEAAKRAVAKVPGIRILTLSSFGEESYYFTMVEAGVKGFILKTAGINELQGAINEIAAGGSWFSSELLQKVIVSLNDKSNHKKQSQEYSARELEILEYICASLTNEQIAQKINLSADTVKWHRANIMDKSGCSDTAGLVIYSIKNRLIKIG